MNFDIRHVPFSRYGSYFVFVHLAGSETKPSGSFGDFSRPVKFASMPGGVYLGTVHGDSLRQEVFHIGLIRDGISVPYQVTASPSVLELRGENAWAKICIAEPSLVRIQGGGAILRLSMPTAVFDHALPTHLGHWEVNSFSNRRRFMLSSIEGKLVMDAPWQAPKKKSEYVQADFYPASPTGFFEAAIEEFTTSWNPRYYEDRFDVCLQNVEDEFNAWLNTVPDCGDFSQARDLAAYLNWSCVVPPHGRLSRLAMFMSKGLMSSLWSWDNCFNAMALVYKNPQLAWDQLMLPFDYQDASGSLPDSINDGNIIWNYCKPPVQGWALRRMMKRTDFIDREHLSEIYRPLCRWTEWWFKYRDDDQDGIPQYNHGNDCGWDNATVFDAGAPVESPDLSAYLIIQMDVLSDVAQRLDFPDEARKWKLRADDLLGQLLTHSWHEDHFVSPRSGDHHISHGDCLINFLPILLGKRLPESVYTHLVAGLKDETRFLTPHGLATENISGLFYESDGYWRGPIWAPSTLILVDGLNALGETDMALQISRGYCEMVTVNGMAENFDALTGAGLRDRAYTWTSSVFMILAHESFTGAMV